MSPTASAYKEKEKEKNWSTREVHIHFGIAVSSDKLVEWMGKGSQTKFYKISSFSEKCGPWEIPGGWGWRKFKAEMSQLEIQIVCISEKWKGLKT